MEDLFVIFFIFFIFTIFLNIAFVLKFEKMCEDLNDIKLSLKSGRKDKAYTELIADDKEVMKAALIEQFLIKEEGIVRSQEFDKEQQFKATIGRYEGIANELGLDIDFLKLSEGLYNKMTLFFNLKK